MREDYEKIITTLYDTYAQDIFRYLFVRLRSREQAQDLVQDVFFNAWTYLSRGKTIENPRSFLYTTAHNVYVNMVTRRHPSVSLEKLTENGFDAASELTTIDEVLEVEDQDTIVKRIHELPDTYREIFLLRYIDGLSVSEIAKLCNQSENTISVRIHRGVNYLQKHYTDWYEFRK